MKKLSILFATLLLGLTACKKAERIPQVPNRIFPLTVGNSWTFADSLIVLIDSIPQETTVTSYSWEVTEAGYVDEPGGDFNRFDSYKLTYRKDSCEKAAFIRSQEDGILILGIQGESGAISLFQPDYIIKYPLNVGSVLVPDMEMWDDCFQSQNSQVFPVVRDTLILASTNTQYTTPAGTFTIHDFGKQIWAEDVGPIRLWYREDLEDINSFEVTTNIRTRTLVSYSLAP